MEKIIKGDIYMSMSVGIEEDTYRVLSAFMSNGVDMVTVEMENAVCVMDKWEYSRIKAEEIRNRQLNKSA